MHKIILFLEHTDSLWFTPKKIGNIFLIVELEDEHNEEEEIFFLNRPDKGTDHFIVSPNIAKKNIFDSMSLS